jgi:hypothetical protein
VDRGHHGNPVQARDGPGKKIGLVFVRVDDVDLMVPDHAGDGRDDSGVELMSGSNWQHLQTTLGRGVTVQVGLFVIQKKQPYLVRELPVICRTGGLDDCLARAAHPVRVTQVENRDHRKPNPLTTSGPRDSSPHVPDVRAGGGRVVHGPLHRCS